MTPLKKLDIRQQLLASGIVLLSGCAAVGPNYQQPELAAPVQWSETQAPAVPAPHLDQFAWWQAFNDPILNSLIDQADQSNLDLAQARARIVQARSSLTIAGAARLPELNTSGLLTRSDYGTNTLGGSRGLSTVYLAGFDASWEIDVFGGLRRGVESAQATADASEEAFHATLLTLRGDLAKNYIELRSNQALLDITQQNVAAMQQTMEVTQARYRYGLNSYLDVAQAAAQKATTAADVPTLKAAIKLSIHRIAVLCGQEPNALNLLLAEPRPMPSYAGLVATGLPAELLSRRPDLRQAERKLAAASADIGVATAELYPKFDLTLGLGLQSYNASSFLERASRYWTIIPGISLPLFNAGKTTAQIESKRAAYDESLASYRATFNTALEEVENALASWYEEQARQQTLVEAVSASEQAVKLAEDSYRRGLTTYLSVLSAENSLFNAQRSHSQSQANLLTDLIALNKALGGGWNISTHWHGR